MGISFSSFNAAVAYDKSKATVFDAALPYGVATLAAGALGATIALVASSTVATIIGIALALFSAYAFMGVVICGLHSKNAQQFQDSIGKTMLTMGSMAFAEIISTVAKVVLMDLIFSCVNRKHN